MSLTFGRNTQLRRFFQVAFELTRPSIRLPKRTGWFLANMA
jgi:hypothetical protein